MRTEHQTFRLSEYRCVRHQEIIEEMIQVVLYDRRSPCRHEHHSAILRHGNVGRAWFPCKHRLKESSEIRIRNNTLLAFKEGYTVCTVLMYIGRAWQTEIWPFLLCSLVLSRNNHCCPAMKQCQRRPNVSLPSTAIGIVKQNVAMELNVSTQEILVLLQLFQKSRSTR